MSGSSLTRESKEDEGPEDKTADDLFRELAEAEETSLGSSADGDEIYEELSEDSPEEIIAAADEDAETHPVDDAILPDEDALDDLLLSDRRKVDGFLWVDTGTASEGGDRDATPFDGDVVDEWSDAFAAASEGDASTEAELSPDADDRGDSAQEITIDVPDPEEVDGAIEDDSETEADRIFSAEPDEAALDSVRESETASAAEDSEDDASDDEPATPGLLGRLLSLLPF